MNCGEVGCDLATREQIVRLVRYHGRPAFSPGKGGNPGRERSSGLSWLGQQLAALPVRPRRHFSGRRTAEVGRPVENLHLLGSSSPRRMAASISPYSFGNDHARFLFYRQQNPQLHYVQGAPSRCQVTMMSGLPGSGKDTSVSQPAGLASDLTR